MKGGPENFIVFQTPQSTNVSFQYAISKNLWVLSTEIGVDTAPYSRYRDMKFGKNFSRNYGNEVRGELSYLAPLGSGNISAPYFKQCFFQGGKVLLPRQSNTTPSSPKTEITNILFYILNFASIIKFKM